MVGRIIHAYLPIMSDFWFSDDNVLLHRSNLYLVLPLYCTAEGKTGRSEHTEICPWNTDNGHQTRRIFHHCASTGHVYHF